MWYEKHRPKDLNTYFGNRKNVSITKNWLESVKRGNPIEEGLLYHGPPGTGKTSLTQALDSYYDDLTFIHTNASDKRQKEDIKKIISKGSTRGLTTSVSINIIDEAEAVEAKYLHDIIESTHTILITNEKYSLTRNIRDRLIDLDFDYPSLKHKIKYIQSILEKESESLDGKAIKYIAQKSRSFRATAKNLQVACTAGSVDFVDDKTDFDKFKEMERLFEGKDVGRADSEPREVLKWALDNGGNPALISSLDRLLGRTPPTDFRSWKYVYDLIQYANASTDVEYPRYFKLLSKYSNKKEKSS